VEIILAKFFFRDDMFVVFFFFCGHQVFFFSHGAPNLKHARHRYRVEIEQQFSMPSSEFLHTSSRSAALQHPKKHFNLKMRMINTA